MTTTRPTVSRVLAALVTGVATTAYYATPDLIRSRTARGWTKAGLGAVTLAVSLQEVRADIAAQRAKSAAEPPTDDTSDDRAADENRTTDEDAQPLKDVPPALLAVGVAALATSVAGTVAFERWVFRRGERLAAAGRPLAHTRAALVLGALSAAVSLIPTDD
ncbi:peptidase S9 [Cellulomonas sp. JZ18]|uniref:peptidase S9 n=1 Tax=Cellulomonas sp. JZ18 TaxID=2654191 RepID=UPI0012D42FC4|nr:peptidase S9 [Cellulomonas sp. JZ18]QGQ17966.1 peptidase S9 [Cellulomonas sp. JZ18]